MADKPATDPETGRFVTGNNAGKGRPKGSRNKLGEAFLDAMHEDFQEHGKQVIETVRLEKPDQYLKVVASILPKELNIRVSELDELTDAELDRRIRALANALSIEVGTGQASGGEAPEVSPQPAGKVSALH